MFHIIKSTMVLSIGPFLSRKCVTKLGNMGLLFQVSIEHLQPGALVRVTDDPAEFEKMQRDWECWGKKSSKVRQV